MKQTLAIKLAPSLEQSVTLRETMQRFNAACDAIAETAFAEQCANTYLLQKLVYYPIRERFGLSAQMTIRAISKVVGAYKRDKTVRPRFRPDGAVPYDQRIMSWRGLEAVSLLTLDGRQIIPLKLGAYQRGRIDRRQGQADLIVRDGVWYLYATLDVPGVPEGDPEDFLGIDLGIVNIATSSDGLVFSGKQVRSVRERNRRLRSRLQAKGTKSARRLLKKRSRRESRFCRDTNHVVSKRIVAEAERTKRGIAVEDLTGIRSRVRARRSQRATLHSWSFHQLGSFLTYKAAAAGVRLVHVDPAHTSQTCTECGCVDRKNRPTRDIFLCVSCGHAGPADHVAAICIGRRAAVMQPHVSEAGKVAPVAPGTSLPL